MISLFLQGAALGLTASATPGTFQSYLITQTLEGGWQRGAPVAFSPLVSDPPIVIFVLLILNQVPPDLINMISILGGLFAMYLAWSLWGNWREDQKDARSNQEMHVSHPQSDDSSLQSSKTTPTSSLQGLRRGALMNVLSPGPYTFWAFISGPIVLEAFNTSLAYGSVFFIGFYTVFIGGMLSIVMLLHLARRLGSKVVRILTLISILILTTFSVVLLLQGISGLLN